MKKTILKESYNCTKCDGGVFQVIRTMTKSNTEIKIKNCTVCKHKWGLKQMATEKPKHILTTEVLAGLSLPKTKTQ